MGINFAQLSLIPDWASHMIPYFIPNMPTTDQLIPYLKEIDTNRWYSNFGPLYDKLSFRLSEELLAGVHPDRIAIVSSGTSAIELALKSLGLPAGANILTSCFTFPATIEAITNVGLTPILCDVDKDSWQLTPDIAEHQISQQNIAAVLPVAAFGMPVCSESWAEFHLKTKIPVVVDAAAALLNQSIHKHLIYAFSLHATKTLGAGEGGIVVSPSKRQTTSIKKLSNFGIEPNRTISKSGHNAKMSEYHCAVGLAQLDRLDNILDKRKDVFEYYLKKLRLANLPISFQADIDHFIPSSLYVLFDTNSAEKAFNKLKAHHIETRRLYYPLINKHKGFENIRLSKGCQQKNAAYIAKKGLALPFHMHLTHEEIDAIARALTELLIT